MSRIEQDRLARVRARLGEAVLEPAVWPDLMEEICRSIGAVGSALLQSDVRTPDIPRTNSVDELFRKYFADGWHIRDVRAERGVPLLLGGQTVVVGSGSNHARRDAVRSLLQRVPASAGFSVVFW